MPSLSVGVAGLGYWGPNLLRNFRSLPDCRLTAMADADPARLATLSRQYPDVRCFESAEEMLDAPGLDAVALALPADALPRLAVTALERGKHVLVEKPMAPSAEDGRRMLAAARDADRVAMADFTFVYSPPVRYLRSLVESGRLGRPHYYQSTRINLGRFQPDVDVVWDLAAHDVSILAHVLGRDPERVTATGSRGPGRTFDTAHATLTYADGFHAYVHVSWLAPTKVRTALLAGRDGMAVYNDVDPDEKIRVYALQQQFEPQKEDAIVPTFRLGDVTIPRLPAEEPLRAMAGAFVDAALGGPRPPTDWAFGARVLSVLEAARHSLATGETARVAAPVAAP